MNTYPLSDGAINNEPLVSVVVCTRNRCESLRAALETYAALVATIPWELIVVDNGSSDGTDALLASERAKGRLPIRIVSAPMPGLSRARNVGWHAARADIVAFSDDDCYPHTSYVHAVWRAFRTAGIAYIGGRVLLHDPGDWPITIQESTMRADFPAGAFLPSGLLHGANMAFRREVLVAIRGFDELLGAGAPLKSSEDVDAFNAASAHGFAGAYDPEPTVNHHHRRSTLDQVSALQRSYDFGRGAFFAKGILDAGRRGRAIREWYWRSWIPAASSLAGARKLRFELAGALRYVVLRIRRSRAPMRAGI